MQLQILPFLRIMEWLRLEKTFQVKSKHQPNTTRYFGEILAGIALLWAQWDGALEQELPLLIPAPPDPCSRAKKHSSEQGNASPMEKSPLTLTCEGKTCLKLWELHKNQPKDRMCQGRSPFPWHPLLLLGLWQSHQSFLGSVSTTPSFLANYNFYNFSYCLREASSWLSMAWDLSATVKVEVR